LVGIGTFNVADGALAVSQAQIVLGLDQQAEGEVFVDGPGTEWITFDTLYIGYEGSGGLVVSNGGDVLSSNATISETPTGIGSTQVDGDSSKWTITGNFHVGKAGVGFVQLLNGGVLDNSTGVTIIGPLGSIDISGGTIYVGLVPPVQNRVAGFLDDDTTGELHGETTTVTGGSMFLNTLILEDGATVLADSVVFGEGGTIGGSGTFDFDVTNSGAVTPGGPLAAGTFTVNAGYTQLSSGVLLIELGGLDPGQGHDQLMVTATAQLGGTLDVSAINDFEPQVGQVYEIISANTVTGTFDQIVSHGGLGFDVAYTNNNVSITITSPLGVEDEIEDLIPTDYVLYQNYPNPFNPTTKIKYGIPNSGLITLQVYNLLGEVVTTLVNKQQSAGNYEVSFDAASAAGGLSSGIYLYKIQAGDYSDLKKMILLR
ncbi:MAG: T9SS type A sorting domain-containing protein, partial [Bacteroidetes bacterium]|nr:T9SS type A sorting domain-containing protein [Bacteroidota bacterium]